MTELKATILNILEESDDPMEPIDVVHQAMEQTGVSNEEARDALRELTHVKRSERKVQHILDGRLKHVES